MTGPRGWFEVDRSGLAAIAKRRGIHFVVTEPIQNGWDEPSVSRVDVTLTAVEGSPRADLTVADDAPDGFRDLADSYSLFRESYKVGNPEQRGRFNVGEKLLLAVAEEASVVSTTGSVIFDADGRRRGRKKTERGSVLSARLRMTRVQLAEALAFAKRLIPPAGIVTTVNGEPLPERAPLATTEASVETETRGEDGGFRWTTRKTEIRFYEPLPGEKPFLYEMGIPIDEVACPWHVEVMQKVPLSVDRASVRYGYRDRLQAIAADTMARRLDKEQARAAWVAEAIERMDDDEAVRAVVEKRFGKAVVYDPSDPEAGKRALDAGYHVVRGGELSRTAWAVVRRAEAIPSAGKVFHRGVETSPDGAPPVDRAEWTPRMTEFARYAQAFTEHALDRAGAPLEVNFYRMPGSQALAFCGGGEIGLNLSTGGTALLDRWNQAEVDQLLIHEVAHVRAKDHLTDAFHTECCRIGAVMMRNFWDTLKWVSL